MKVYSYSSKGVFEMYGIVVPRFSTLSSLPQTLRVVLHFSEQMGVSAAATAKIIHKHLRPYLTCPLFFSCYLSELRVYAYNRVLATHIHLFVNLDLKVIKAENAPLVKKYWAIIAREGYGLHERYAADLHQIFRRLIDAQKEREGANPLDFDLRSFQHFLTTTTRKLQESALALGQRLWQQGEKWRKNLSHALCSPDDLVMLEYWCLQYDVRAPTYLNRRCWRRTKEVISSLDEPLDYFKTPVNASKLKELALARLEANRVQITARNHLIHRHLIRPSSRLLNPDQIKNDLLFKTNQLAKIEPLFSS